MKDFDEWMKSIDIDITKQKEQVQPLLMIFERLYDLIVDTRKNMK